MALTKAPEELLDKDLTSALGITTADNLTQLTLKSTDTDANVGPRMDFTRDSSSPAASDSLGQIRFMGEDAGDNSISYAHMTSFIVDPTDGSEDGKFEIDVRKAGTQRSRLLLDENETVFNNEQQDIDFRVEGDSDTHALFVQASDGSVGIGASSPTFGSGSGLEISRSGTATLRVERTGSTASSGEFFAGNGKVVLSSISNNHLEFRTNNTENMRINSSGEIQIGGTTNAGFIDFDGTNLQLNTQRNPNSGAFVNSSKSHAFIGLQGTNGGSTITFGTASSNNTTSTSRMIIESGGNVEITNGNLKMNSGNGIDFSDTSDNAGMTNELLDDYEEGTWTPTLESTGSCTFATSNYTKVGRLVTVCTTISNISNTSSTNTFAMSLPFSAIGNDRTTPSGFITTNVAIDLAGGYLASSSVIYFYANSTGAYRPLKHSDFSATTAIYVAFTYMSA